MSRRDLAHAIEQLPRPDEHHRHAPHDHAGDRRLVTGVPLAVEQAHPRASAADRFARARDPRERDAIAEGLHEPPKEGGGGRVG